MNEHAAPMSVSIGRSTPNGDCLFDSMCQCLRAPHPSVRELVAAEHTVAGLRHIVASELVSGRRDDVVHNWVALYAQFEKEADGEMLQEYAFVRQFRHCTVPLSGRHAHDVYKTLTSRQYWGDEIAIKILAAHLRVRTKIMDHVTVGRGHWPTLTLHFRAAHYSPVFVGGHGVMPPLQP